MASNKVWIVFLIIFFGALFQTALIASDCRQDAPYAVATNFAKAYFKLDPAMGQYLCSELSGDQETDAVGNHIYLTTQEARERGFSKAFMKNRFYQIHTRTRIISADEAEVHLSGKRRISICPFFAWVAQIFFIGETYPVEATLELVKQDGIWKVCGRPFTLNQI